MRLATLSKGTHPVEKPIYCIQNRFQVRTSSTPSVDLETRPESP
jgi:hypothetical protein